MSSFYGNIKFNNQTPLIFDKIYSSRKQMEDSCHSDGIFNGRFVLISYGDIQYTPYHKISYIGEEEFNNSVAAGTVYYIVTSDLQQYPEGFKPTNIYSEYNSYFIRREYGVDNTSVFAQNKSIDELNYKHDYHNTVWQKIWTSTQDSEEITEKYIMISHLNAETPKVTMIVDAPSDIIETEPTNRVYYLIPTDQDALNIDGRISEREFNQNKNKLFLKSDTLNEDEEYDYTPAKTWNINTIYYEKVSDNPLYYDTFKGEKPYVNGMISQGLYEDLIYNRETPLFIRSDNSLELDELEALKAEAHRQMVNKLNELDVYDEHYEAKRRNILESYFQALNDIDRQIDDNNQHGNYIPAGGWEATKKYYLMRFRETDGRPHFDPIMSTDLEYRFHMPRNWKIDNNTDFEYNIAGFYPERANYLGVTRNEIYLTNKQSGDLYPVHRADEPSAAVYDDQLNIKKVAQEDTKHFNFNLKMIGDVMSKIWDLVYPRDEESEDPNIRNMFIGNDRDPANKIDFPGTLAEAVRKLYYWLGIKSDNNFIQGPWIDPKTKEEVDTIFGVLNGASDLLGHIGDHFDEDLFIPVASPYYPDGYDRLISDDGFTGLKIEEFNKLNNGGAGPLYIRLEDGSYIQAIDFNVNDKTWEGYTTSIESLDWNGYDKEIQYYRNMNSLFGLLYEWQDIVKDCQGDWTYEGPDENWTEGTPLHPRFIRNKPIVLGVDKTYQNTSSINWYWKNYGV